MSPELEPTIGTQLAKREAQLIAALVRGGFGERRKELEKERTTQQRNNTRQPQPLPLPKDEPQEIPKQ